MNFSFSSLSLISFIIIPCFLSSKLTINISILSIYSKEREIKEKIHKTEACCFYIYSTIDKRAFVDKSSVSLKTKQSNRIYSFILQSRKKNINCNLSVNDNALFFSMSRKFIYPT